MQLTFYRFKYLICFLFDNILIVYQWLTITRYIMADDRVIYINKLYCRILLSLFVCLMVFNATFNNISVISWRSVLLVEETGGPGENHRTDKLYHIMLYTSLFMSCYRLIFFALPFSPCDIVSRSTEYRKAWHGYNTVKGSCKYTEKH